ncbi:RNA methyltransferase [Roseospirillum parvum]|uniref:tRNA (cytidine/uridine-2'-O-)-methyltransferase TrmJ n=1 Tax=Roseospirillum parvum TaxID=83401 RepID=A0A1G8CJU0_9PROT|nr:RNA methyltransferase [Roseospirillum parvum]SDH45609.1 tRNA/rRNA methyltransferase [Roseospirillum parvum]
MAPETPAEPEPMPAPAVILVQPQLAENVGTTARAMHNCGLGDLRLVEPREDWLGDKAVAAASGADAVLRAARAYPTTAAAVADLHRVLATTARRRDMVKPLTTPRQAAQTLGGVIAAGHRAGVLFGPERAGLGNDDVALADAIIEVPLNPAYRSLNLAQAVLLVGYEWFQAHGGPFDMAPPASDSPPATQADLDNLHHHLFRELEDCGFLRSEEKRPGMKRNIRNIFQRAGLSVQEVRTLHGIVKELRHGRR